ncbi:hypothetical protein [Parafrankia sp. FMc2]|uniref:hypothetical protein n=1 Tax=Parafrankia sp. FMc2 TaxID=3233196 RepID=UPI0034D45DCF
MDQTAAAQSTELYESLQAAALTAARSVDDTDDRARTLGLVASQTRPFDTALPLWTEAAETARKIEDPATRVDRMTSLVSGLRYSAAK